MLQLITCYNSLKHWDIHGYTTNDWFGIPVKWEIQLWFWVHHGEGVGFRHPGLGPHGQLWDLRWSAPKAPEIMSIKIPDTIKYHQTKIITYQLNIIKCHGLMTNKYTKDELTSSCWHCSHWTSVLRSARRALSQSCRWEAIPVSLSAP